MPDQVALAERSAASLRCLRSSRKGWTQSELATRLKVSRQTVNAIETERYEPSLSLAFAIAELFGQPIESIFRPKRRYSKDDGFLVWLPRLAPSRHAASPCLYEGVNWRRVVQTSSQKDAFRQI